MYERIGRAMRLISSLYHSLGTTRAQHHHTEQQRTWANLCRISGETAEKSLLHNANLSLSTSLSLVLLLCSLALSRSFSLPLSLFYSATPSIQLNLSPLSLSLLLSFLPSLFFLFYLSLISHFLSFFSLLARSDSLHISLPFSLSVFFLFSFNFSLLLFFSDPLTYSIRLTSCLPFANNSRTTSSHRTAKNMGAHNINIHPDIDILHVDLISGRYLHII